MTIRIDTYGEAPIIRRLLRHMRRREGFVPAGFGVTDRFRRENQALFD